MNIPIRNLLFKSFFLFSILSHCLFSQTKSLEGVVTDSLHNALPFATIQMLDSIDNVSYYTFTDNVGKFRMTFELDKASYIKITHIGFKPFIKPVKDFEEESSLTFVLKEKTEILDEVEIIEFDYGVKTNQKKDSIFYDISKFVRGTETTLGDVLEKLPGIGVTANGKITYNNKMIDQLLIEDAEFFGNMHQLATQNIDANAVKSAEVYRNYQKFGTLENNPDNDLVALNVKVKDEYKNRISGNGKVDFGIKDKYHLGLNLFNFNKGPRLNFISNFNNKGVQPISVQDYQDLQLGSYEYDSSAETGVTVKHEENELVIPDFLQSNDDVFENEDRFAGLNFNWKPTKKIKIDFFSFLNQKKQKGYSRLTQNYFSPTSTLMLQNENNRANSSLVNLTKLKAVFVPNKKNTFQYFFSYTPHKNNIESDILNTVLQNTTSINQEKDFSSYRLKNTLTHNTVLAERITWKNSISLLNQSSENILHLTSDQSLFEGFPSSSISYIEQTQLFSDQTLTINSAFFIHSEQNKNEFNVFLEKKNSRKTFRLSGNFNQPDDDLNLQNNNVSAKALYRIKSGLLNYKIGGSIYSYRLHFQDEKDNATLLIPHISVSVEFSGFHQFILSYNNQFKFPEIKKLNSSTFFNNYQTLTTDSKILYQNRIPRHEYSINYFNIDFGKKYIFTSISFSEEKNVVGTNSTFQDQFVYNEPIIVPKASIFNAIISYQSSLNQYSPYKISLSASANVKKTDTKINAILDTHSFSNLNTSAKLFSNYLNKKINFDFGLSYNKSISSFKNRAQENVFELFSIDFGLDGKQFKEHFFWKVYSEIKKSNTSSNELLYTTINALLRLNKIKSRFEITIEANDILNLNSNSLLRTNNSPSFFEEEEYLRFPGFITCNLKFKI